MEPKRYNHDWSTQIKRYNDECGDHFGGDCGLCGPMKEAEDGEWVRYSDVEELLKNAQDQR